MLKNNSVRFSYITVALMLTACSTTGSNSSNLSLMNTLAAPDAKYAGATSIKRLSIPAGLSTPNFVNDFDVPDSMATGATALSLSDRVPSVNGIRVPGAKSSSSSGDGLKLSLGDKPAANLNVVSLSNGITGLLIPETGQAAWSKLNIMLAASGFTIESKQPDKQQFTTVWKGTRYQTLAMVGTHRIKVEKSFLAENSRYQFGLVPYQGQTAIVVKAANGGQANDNEVFSYLKELY